MLNGKDSFLKGNIKPKSCPCCYNFFTPKSGFHKFCSEYCKGKWKYITGQGSTENQYKVISGDWRRYLARLQYVAGRKRDFLSVDILLKVLEEQNYKCALSGIPLTCKLEKGKKFFTNVSVDRIIAGGPYTRDNIQLVCRGLNSWRSDTPLGDFIELCRKVAENNPREEREVKDGPAQA